MQEKLVQAIRERAVLRIYYAPGWRMIEPHALGYSSKGSLLLRCFQTSGASSSGRHSDWKLFTVGKIHQLEQSGETFLQARPGYNPAGDQAMKKGIIARL